MLPALPDAFVSRMQDQLGSEFPDFLEALHAKPITSVRLNPRKPGAEFSDGYAIPWCEGGFYLPERPKFFRDPLIYTGAYYVQEASSMLVAQCLDYKQDMRVLDLCAAPGGKSTLLATRLSPGSLLVSNEVVGNRSRALIDNLSRWGHPNTIVTNNHPRDFQQLRHAFDAIVIDAPCSGEGMFRKDPKVIGTWSPGVVRNCALRQKDILGQTLGSLKPGGRLVYSTCTYNAQENEAIVQWILDREPGTFEIVPLEFPAEWGLVPGRTEGYSPAMAHTYHCYPHLVQGEGFYFACLQKVDAGRQVAISPSQQRKQNRKHKGRRGGEEREERPKVQLGKKEAEIASGYIAGGFELLERREGFDAVPPEFVGDVEELGKALRIFKAGIRMGTVNKGKFIPDHDLALSEAASEAVPRIDIEAQTALEYMKRQSLTIDSGGVRDWAILRYGGRDFGWVKALDNRLNNHLPKELRLRAEI